jgi:glycosyltransferase involved in cell wall biosynthesis
MAQLVSILIPCYNAEKWLKYTIASVLGQTWPNKEIIIVDDGSTDCSLQIAKQYESNIVKVISQKNKGGSAARNKAFEYAQGSYIQWLDSDDILAPDKIEYQMKEAYHLKNPKILLSSSWAEFYYRCHKAKFVKSNLWNNLDPVEWLTTKFNEHVYMTNNTWLVSRELTELAGPWDERLSMDQDGEYFSRIVAACEKVVFVPQAKCYYRRGSPKSISGGLSKKAKQSAILSKILCITYLRAIEDSEKTRKASLEFLKYDLDYHYLEQTSIKQHVNALAKELGGELSPPAKNWRLSLARVFLGRNLAEKTRRLWWVSNILAKANWDKLLYSLSSK